MCYLFRKHQEFPLEVVLNPEESGPLGKAFQWYPLFLILGLCQSLEEAWIVSHSNTILSLVFPIFKGPRVWRYRAVYNTTLLLTPISNLGGSQDHPRLNNSPGLTELTEISYTHSSNLMCSGKGQHQGRGEMQGAKARRVLNVCSGTQRAGTPLGWRMGHIPIAFTSFIGT